MRRGYDLGTLCEASGVSPASYLATGQRFGPGELSRISRHVKRLMDDEFCGMTRQRCKAGTFFLIGELILPCQNLKEALGKVFRFYDLTNDGIRFDLIAGTEFADLRVHVMEPELSENHFLEEWYLLVWRNFCSWLIGEEIPVLRTRFAHAQQGSPEEYALVFDSKCLFEQLENSMTFRSAAVSRRRGRVFASSTAINQQGGQ